jgi:glutathione synthase/RimK-type ligase-like ATP-grasp enzyme
MKTGLLLNSNNKLSLYSEKFHKILLANKIPVRLIDPNSRTLFADLEECSHLIFHHSQGDTDLKIYDTIYNIAHRIFGIKCLPDFDTYWLYEDKIKEYYLLKSKDFPVVDTHVFWNIEHADAFIKEAHYPIIAKLPKGAASTNVVLVRSPEEAKSLNRQVFIRGVRAGRLNNSSNLRSFRHAGFLKHGKTLLRSILIDASVIRDMSYFPEWQIQKDAILYQKFLPNNFFDQRIVIIGNRAFGARRFVRKNDFRASGSGLCDLNPGNIDLRCVEISFSISGMFNFSAMGYDFIYDENKWPYINEFGYCFADYVLKECPGYWDKDLVWHKGQQWPQFFQLADFLQADLEYSCDYQS